MKCPKCGYDYPADARFCNECGEKLETACPVCGKTNPPDSKFCNGCGQSLSPSLSTPLGLSRPHSYTPKFLAEKILTSRSSVEGERKLVTVLFADVANFTAISEKLDPEEIHGIMDGCFKILMDEIHRFEGTINQFTGDGVMALFGAPLAHEDHALRACRASLAIQHALDDYGAKLKKSCGIDFTMRIGLNSGPVVVGAIGDDLRMDYTAIGDTINLASRMESAAEPGTILVSGHTHKLVKDFFTFSSLGPIQVKGKEDPQEAYQLMGASTVRTRLEASVSSGLTRFVGRTKEMEILNDALEKARSGSGQVVGIVGEAGVGKSRIIFEMRHLLPDHAYLEGRCLHYGGSMAYLPLLDILRSYFEIKEGEREYLINKKMKEKLTSLDEHLTTALAPFQDLLSLEPDNTYRSLEPRQKQERIFEALRDLFIRESQNRLLVLIIEDLHWIDKTSEEFLDYLIGWLANTSILLFLLYRPEYTHRWASKSSYTNIRVDQLSLSTSSQLVQSILSEGEVVPELRDLILGKAAGNPLFMEELTHSLLENGSIQKKEDHYILSRKLSDIQVPDTVQGIISARIDRLDESLKRIMHVASVIGREFTFRILQSITDLREELKSHLLNLQGLEFIYEKRLFPELEYIFKHALTQEVAYNSLLLARRKEIHGRIGMAIEELYADRLEEFYEMLAWHYSRSNDLAKGIAYGEKAAARASSTYAYAEAIRLLEAAVKTQELLDPEDKGKRCDLLLGLGDALTDAGEARKALDTAIPRAFELAETIGDTERASQACQKATIGLVFWASVSGAVWGTPEAAEWVNRADRYAAPGTLARVWADMAKAASMSAKGTWTEQPTLLAEAVRFADAALGLARQLGDPEVLCHAAISWLMFARAPQNTPTRVVLADEFSQRPIGKIEVKAAGTILILVAYGFLECGMRTRAEEMLRLLNSLAERTKQPDVRLQSFMADCAMAVMDGRLQEAVEIALRMKQLGEEVGLSEFAAFLARSHITTPRLLLGVIDDVLKSDIGPSLVALSLALTGRDTEAWTALTGSVSRRIDMNPAEDGSWVESDAAWLEVAVRIGHRHAVEFLLHRLADSGRCATVAMNQTCVGRHLGAAAAFLGRPDEARTYYSQALEVAGKLRFRPEIALTRLQLAELLLEHYPDEKPEALENLDFAIAEFREMKMAPSLERVMKLRETIG
jgi:class 3 adenylate cyclase/tetratricopeptide (TPR) repeat protein